MIDKSEINTRAKAEGLRFDQIEKDHVILWILHALSQSELKPEGWIFKGGTCLRHCYYSGYRFSEDLDFSCDDEYGGVEEALRILQRVTEWVQANALFRVSMKEPQTSEGDFQVEIPVEYSRGGPRRHGLPAIKIHLTFDEPILTQPESRPVGPPYSDLSPFAVIAYSKEEILAEKTRALLQQQSKWPRPRDLYDLWFIICHKNETFEWETLFALFVEKCRARKIEPDTTLLVSETLKSTNERAWESQLEMLMREVPDFEEVWKDWFTFCKERFSG
jgi:predicted nucleotidyltransferase component of viral defense system